MVGKRVGDEQESVPRAGGASVDTPAGSIGDALDALPDTLEFDRPQPVTGPDPVYIVLAMIGGGAAALVVAGVIIAIALSLG